MPDFVAFLNKVNREVPAELDVHVTLDSVSTHKTPKSATGCSAKAGSTSNSPPPTGHG